MRFDPTVLWLVGEPGTGKTAIARTLLGAAPHQVWVKPKWTLADIAPIASGVPPMGVAAAGTFNGTAFDGSDTVPYSGAAEALETWAALIGGRARLTVFDGDRFSTGSSLHFFRLHKARAGLRLKCVHLLDGEAAAMNRRQREIFHGLNPQNESWVKGRATKAANFAEHFPAGDVLVIRNLLTPVKVLTDEITRWLETNL